jgi:hypothetical protein
MLLDFRFFFVAPSRRDSNRATLASFGGRPFKARFLFPLPLPPLLYLLGFLSVDSNGRLRGFIIVFMVVSIRALINGDETLLSKSSPCVKQLESCLE